MGLSTGLGRDLALAALGGRRTNKRERLPLLVGSCAGFVVADQKLEPTGVLSEALLALGSASSLPGHRNRKTIAAAVFYAAESGDTVALTEALDGGGSTEEMNKVRPSIRVIVR